MKGVPKVSCVLSKSGSRSSTTLIKGEKKFIIYGKKKFRKPPSMAIRIGPVQCKYGAQELPFSNIRCPATDEGMHVN